MIDMKEAHRLTRESVAVTKVSYRFALSLVMKQLWSELKELAAEYCPLRGGFWIGHVVLKGSFLVHNVWSNGKCYAVGDKGDCELTEIGYLNNFDWFIDNKTKYGKLSR